MPVQFSGFPIYYSIVKNRLNLRSIFQSLDIFVPGYF